MALLLSILIFLAAVLLILVVLIQNPKGGGLASEFSSANQIGGVQETADFLEKATWTLAVGIMVLTLMRAGVTGSGGTSEEERSGSQLEEVINEQMGDDPATPTQRAPRGQQGQQGGQGAPSGQSPSGSQGKGSSKDIKEELKKKKQKEEGQ